MCLIFLMFNIVSHKSAIWFWNLVDAHALQSITAQPWRLFCCQGLPDAGCALQSGRHVHMTSVRCCFLAHYPSWTRFPHTKNSCIQALWQCLSMPGKPRPLVALNSIMIDLAGPAETRVARMESEFTAQSPVEGARCLKKSVSLCEEGPLRGRRIWGSDYAYLRRRCWAKRPHFRCLETKLDPLVRL